MSKSYAGRYEGDIPSIVAAWDRLFTEPPPYVALDTETPSLKDTTILGVGIATPENDNFFFDFTEANIPWHLIMPSKTRKIWHNCTFDLSWEVLGQFGADIDNIEDTAILMRLMNLDIVLSEAARNVDSHTWSVKELFADYGVKSMRDLPWEAMARKCISDARVTLLLYEKYRSLVSQEQYEVERRISSMLLHMSHRGIKLDKELVNSIEAELGSEAEFYKSKCQEWGFNPLAPKAVGIALTQQGIFLPWKRGKSQPTVDKTVLAEADSGIGTLTLLARKYNKLHSVVRGWVGKDRVYSHFHLDSATSRITSEKIQLHNIPTGYRAGDIIPKAGPIRRVLMPDKDKFTNFDLSQVELRVLTEYTKDPVMYKALNNPTGLDIHSTTQQALGIYSRVMAKNFNFGYIYGGSAAILSQFTGIKDLELIAQYQRKYRETYPNTWQWLDRQISQGLRDGYVTTLYGRKLSLRLAMQSGEKHAANCAVNYPIQGSAAEIFKRILLALWDSGIPIEDFILQVHDSQLLDGNHKLPIEDLEHITNFWTPLEVEYIARWQ